MLSATVKLPFFFCLISFCFFAHAAEAADEKPLLTILYTAEAHAALLPCDCPLQPLGGVARRATLIKRYRERGKVLLLDGGGWAAGGIYDEDSDGDPIRDALRTQLMACAMQLMRYDGIVPGPDEAQVDARLLPSQVLTEKPAAFPGQNASMPLELYGWSEPRLKLFGREAPDPPGPRPQIVGWRAPEIHISRLGEEGSELLASNIYPLVVVNAGRKTSQRIGWRAGATTLANFDYQARHLGVIEIFTAKAEPEIKKLDKYFSEALQSEQGHDVLIGEIRVRMEPLTPEIPDDPEVSALLAPYLEALNKKSKKRLEIEFWSMPECPGCRTAHPEVQRLAADLAGRADFRVHFLVHKQDGKLASLHGEGELSEARIQALVEKYYPEKIWEWLLWRDEHLSASWEEGVAKLGLLPARIRGALSAGEGDALLESDFELAERRHVTATPSLVIANSLYDGDVERLALLRVLCGLLADPKPAACKDAPACFFDAQCKKRGFIGRCIDAKTPAARCDYSQAAVKVPARVIVDPEALYDNHERIMEALILDLPGIEFRVVPTSDFGPPVLTKLKRVPAYLIDTIAQKEVHFAEKLGGITNEVTWGNPPGYKWLVMRDDAVGANRLTDRPRVKGRADLFVSRFSKNGQEALEEALACAKTPEAAGLELHIHDTIYWKENGKEPGKRELAATGGVAEVEEAARSLAARKVAPELFNAYLIERGKARGSSYWEEPLKTLGIDAAKVRALAEGPSPEILNELQAEADLLKSLDAGGSITLLAENCELIPINSRKDLRQTLERIAQRK